ncbi:class I SAM-dependent methyltransferase [Chloroflexota bacterium]
MVALKEKDRAAEILEPKGYLQHTVYRNLLQLRRLNLIVEQVLAYARSKQSDRLKILELGCGIGAISFPLSSLGYQVVGVDIDSSSISECNNRNSFPNARYLVADAETADLKEKFDVVIASEILEHCPHPYKVLETLGRHLRPDGIGIVTVPNGYCLSELIFSRLFQKIGIHSLFHKMPRRLYTLLTGSPTPYYSLNVFCHHIHFFTLKRFLRLLSSHGFKISGVYNLDLGLLLDWNCLSALKRLECKLAESAPHAIAGGWVFVLKEGEE